MGKEQHNAAIDVGLLALRLTTGGLMAGHGAQKLFGSFGGHGLEGTAGFLESLGLRPGKQWAALAGIGEFGSGVLTALGLGGPIGPIAMYGPMIMASATVHAGKPIWVTSGGAELPLVYMSNVTALALAGPGRFSLDKAFGFKTPLALVALTAAGVAAGITFGLLSREQPVQDQPANAAKGESTVEFQAREGDAEAGPANPAPGESVEEFKARQIGAG
jgi:putative oxidoreductase